ncbi:MAG TPA: DUF6151 family protein [Povalibacter sp.]|nr:DUF6151 family protein [Povalibacter sp.]
MNTHPLRCRCGTVQGQVTPASLMNHAVCYCTDCQAYAHALDRASEILDQFGGTEVVAVRPMGVTITQGKEALACLSLTERGLLRWYARCCTTPIANTPRNFRIAYVGLMHNCLEQSSASVTDAFGPIALWVNPKTAHGRPPLGSQNMLGAALGILGSMVVAQLSGSYRRTAFFSSTGTPVASPRVLTPQELERARSAARG